MDARGGTQSIHRTLAILRALAAGLGGGLGLQEVATATGLPRPTVHRMLRALVDEGAVEQHAQTRRYAIGEGIPMLALARARRPPLLGAAEPVVEQLAREIGDTVFLTVRTGVETLCIGRRIGSYPIQVLVIEVGARRPLGVSSAGIAILAALPDAEVGAVLAGNADRLRAYRLDARRAATAVALARQRGCAVSDPGLVPGTKALSVAIPQTAATPLAALTVAAIRQRLRPRREGELRDALRTAVATIVRRVGGAA
jgi:DNA-binding IclR family transcriptional regulator